MTVSNTNSVSGPYFGNGATTAFPFAFKAMTTTEVAVYADEALVSSSLYTVALAANGGTVTFAAAPADDVEILIISDPDFTQDIALENNGAFHPAVLDEAYDRAAVRDISMKARLDKVMPASLLAVDLAGKYLAFDVDENPVASSGTGADAGLREDLAEDGGPLIGLSLPDFPAIVTSLGDALPYINASEFFGISSDGASDDTLKLQAAIQAISNNSACKGGILRLKPGATTITTNELVLRPFVELDLMGGVLQPNLAGGNPSGLRIMSDTTLRNGMIDVRSTGAPGSQAMIHGPIMVGVGYHEYGPAYDEDGNDTPHEFDAVRRFTILDMTLVSDKDRGPVNTGGALAVQMAGDVAGGILGRIKVPASAVMSGAFGADWGIRGQTLAGNQAIISDQSEMANNKANFLAELAYTTHPRDCHIFDWEVGALTRPYNQALADTGTWAARLSGTSGMRIERFVVDLTTQSAFIQHAGDLGAEFARDEDVRNFLRGNKFIDCRVKDAWGGNVISSDSEADNVRRAVDANGYTPIHDYIWPTDVLWQNVGGYSSQGEDAEYGVTCLSQDGGKFDDLKLIGFRRALRFRGARNIDVVGGVFRESWEANIVAEEGCRDITLTNVEKCDFANQAEDNFSNVEVYDCDGFVIDGGSYGAEVGEETALYCIRLIPPITVTAGPPLVTTLGARNVEFRNGPKIHAHKLLTGAAIYAADAAAHGPLSLFTGVKYGPSVTTRYGGQTAVPCAHRGASDGSTIIDYDIADSAATLTGLPLRKGARLIYCSPAAGGKAGKVATSEGTVGTLNGGSTTADTTSGSTAITVSAITGLQPGHIIAIAGVTGNRTVISIDGLSVTLDFPATATVNDGAVSFPATGLKEWGAIDA